MENVELPLEETPERKRVKRLWFWIAIAAVACFVGLIALGIVATLVVPNVLQKFAMASKVKASVDIVSIDSAIREFRNANGGKAPDSLQLLVTPDVNGQTFLVGTEVPKDPWGRPYFYEPPGPGNPRSRVYSYGRDGQPGGDGDDADIDSSSIARSK